MLLDDLMADRAGAGVGWFAKLDGPTTENLCYGFKPGVDFKLDLRFKFHVYDNAAKVGGLQSQDVKGEAVLFMQR